ncbi:hypothetical protein HKX48_005880 [Thoreauomyces humboldtii]|nr:hypothetical protein HKX48_005880 [Thoreauomyces humboldtii]
MSSPRRRIETDVMKLLMSDYEVTLVNDNMQDMINIFEVFLPQLLCYPNPTDPLNGEAAALLMREPASYELKVKGRYPAENIMRTIGLCSDRVLRADYVTRYATKEAADAATDESESDECMSSVGDFSDDDAPGLEL